MQPSTPAINFKAIETKNQANLKALPEGAKVPFLMTMSGHNPVVLIGSGHPPAVSEMVRREAHSDHGDITIVKGSTFSAGEIKVHGCTHKPEFTAAIARFSKKKVTFV